MSYIYYLRIQPDRRNVQVLEHLCSVAGEEESATGEVWLHVDQALTMSWGFHNCLARSSGVAMAYGQLMPLSPLG